MDNNWKFICWCTFGFTFNFFIKSLEARDFGVTFITLILGMSLFFSTIPFKVGKHLTEFGKHFVISLMTWVCLIAVISGFKLILFKYNGGYAGFTILILMVVVFNTLDSHSYIMKKKSRY